MDSLTRLSPSSATFRAANSIMYPLMVHLAQPLRVRREPIACLTHDLIPWLVTGVESGREIVTLTNRLGLGSESDLDPCLVASRALASSSTLPRYQITYIGIPSLCNLSILEIFRRKNNMLECFAF